MLIQIISLLVIAPSRIYSTAIEDSFIKIVSPDSIREYLKYYTSDTKIAGTNGDYLQALNTKQRWESFGLDTAIAPYYPYLTYPIKRRLALTYPFKFNATLKEDIIDG
jgi:N-acetylated-alpha-linked acidic dipeptidase